MIRLLALLSIVLLAGCAAPAATRDDVGAPPLGALKPGGDLVAPTFHLVGAIARSYLPADGDVCVNLGCIVYVEQRSGLGEPSIAAAPDGTLYVTFPGCDVAPELKFVDRLPEEVGEAVRIGPVCEAPPFYRSQDDGATWERMNDPQTGRLSPETPFSNGDGTVAVDSAGSVYVTALGPAGIESQRSDDRGETWVYTGNLWQFGNGTDRQWIGATGNGHVIHNWWAPDNGMGQFAVRTTFDGGTTYTDQQYYHQIDTQAGSGAFHEGPPQFSPDGKTAYIPYPIPREDNYRAGLPYGIHLAKSTDGGLTWEDIDTGVDTVGGILGMAGYLTLAVTSDGHLAITFAEEVLDPTGQVVVGAVVKVTFSTDERNWTAPLAVSTTPSAVFAWSAAGAEDRVAITYYGNRILDVGCDGIWDLRTAIVDLDEGVVADALVDEGVHFGGIQSGGMHGACPDRSFLDYLQNTVLPDGRIAIAYSADPPEGGKYTEIRVAIQDGGSLMLTRGP